MGSRTTVRKPPSKEFPPAPAGLHQAVCADVWAIWTEEKDEKWGGGLIDKTRIVWELDAEDKDGHRFQVQQKYTASLHEKARLRKDLEVWRGRPFTKAELEGFELENLIGANCQLQVVHNISSDGRTYANVQGLLPLAKGQVKLRVSEGFLRHKDREKQAETEPPMGNPEDGPDDDSEPVPF